MRGAVMNAAGDLAIAMADNGMTAAGKTVLENGIAALHEVKAALDLRRTQYTTDQIDEVLTAIRDAVASPNTVPSNAKLGRLRKVTPEVEKSLQEAAISVDRLIGLYRAGKRNALDNNSDEMAEEVQGEMPENWGGSVGYYTDESGRYAVMHNSSTGYALFDGKFNTVRPNKIAYVRSWKDVTDTIDYNEKVRRLPDMDVMAEMNGLPDLDPESWRMGPLLDVEDPDLNQYADELSDDAPRMGYIKAPSFYGPAFDNMPKKASYQEIAEYIQSNIPEYYVFDFETTGLPELITPNVKNDPIQIAIAKVVGGEVVDTLSYYMNPESDLSDWSAQNLTVGVGDPISKDWLSAQMSKREAMDQFLKFVPQNAVLAGHNAGLFDMEILNRTMKSVGLPEYKAGGFIDTWGLASYVIPTPKNNPNNLPEEEIAKSHKLGDLVEFFNIPVTGMHNAKNDVEATAQLLGQTLKFGNDGKAVNGEEFDLTKSKNGFSFPRYKALAETYKTQASEWIARNAEELISMGYGTSVDDFINFLSYPYNATGGKSTSSGSMLDDVDGTGEGAGVTAPISGRPTDKQFNSIMRRLMINGLFPEKVYNMIVEELPNLDRESIGWWIQYADAAEVKYMMANNRPVDFVRVPPALQPVVSKYMAENFPAVSDSSDEMSEEVPGTPKDKITIEDLQKIDVDWSLLPEGVVLTEEGKNIVRAVIGGYNTMVQALAGTGKTFNIEMATMLASILRPGDGSAYLVFNNNIAEEARGKLPDAVEVRTSDSLAVNAEVNAGLYGKMKAQNKSAKFRPVSLTENSIGLLQYLQGSIERKVDDSPERLLEIENMPFSKAVNKYAGVKDMEGKQISSEKVVKAAGDAVSKWVISGDDDISEKHFIEDEVAYSQELLDLAKFMWEDIMAPVDEGRSQIQVEFSHLFKNWALTHPNLRQVNGYGKSKNGFKGRAPSIVFLDEAQDINEVFYQMLREQNDLHGNGLQIVAVGDSNQSLYEFRGAMNAIAKFDRDITLPLTQSYRSGTAITDYGNMFLDAKAEDNVRLVGSPNIKSEVLEANTMTDYTAVVVNTNIGALDAISYTNLIRPNDTIGVVPAFKYELDLFIKTARWLAGEQDPLKKPKNLLPALASFKNWKELKQEHELHGSPGLGKYLGIIDRAMKRADSNNIWDALAELEKLSGRLRMEADGFVVPEKIGTSGSLGNALGYRIENSGKKIIIFNDTYRSASQLLPYQGTSNNKAILKQHGFEVEGFEYVLEGRSNDSRKVLQKLVDDLSGKDIDAHIITTHRSKGLEYDRVRIWTDFPGGYDPDIEGGATEAQKAELQRSIDAQKDVNELNKAYTAVTRAKYALDPGSLGYIEGKEKLEAMVTKMEKILDEGTREENEVKNGASGMINSDIQYDVSFNKNGGKITLNVKGSTTKYDKVLKGLLYVVSANGRNWILSIPPAEDAAQSLGFRMRAMDELKKRINRFKALSETE
jgi:DNA polymerase III epsilon subunit-like protein